MLALTDHQRRELLAQLGRARSLGFLGPGPVEPHLDHALVFVDALHAVSGTVVDLGSGGGLPGLVVGVARPDLHLVLLDARAVRCRFLEEAVERLGLDAEVVEGRAELAGRSALRGTASAVVARSFGTPATTAECAAPLLEVGGCLVVSEPPDLDHHRWPTHGLAALGLTVGPRLGKGPTVQLLTLTSPCPATYPRRDGLPAKRPLF